MRKKKQVIGVLGGGQLARMMALKAHEMGIELHVLSASKDDPAAQVTSFWTKGDIYSTSDLTYFLKGKNVVTFENEFIDIHSLKKAIMKTKTRTAPHFQVIEKLQDRWSQKLLLQKNGIPTSPFFKIDNEEDLIKSFHFLNKKLVLKKRRFGYDGHGTFFIRSLSECKKMKAELKKGTSFIAEAYIPFKKELACLFASHQLSKVISFPFVETRQKDYRCHTVLGPVHHPQIKSFVRLLSKFIKKIKYEGVIAFEFFQTDRGLLVNEIAPRVHNSGHYSLNALSKDQFSLHIDSILRNPIEAPEKIYKDFAMMNLLGKEQRDTKWKKIKGVFLHDYSKKEKKEGRKMGHLNAVACSPNEALKKLKKAIKSF